MSNEIQEGIKEYGESKNKKNKFESNKSLLEIARSDFIEEKLDEDNNYFEIDKNYFESVAFDDFLDYLKNSKYGELALDIVDYSDKQKEIISNQLKNEIIKIRVLRDKNSRTLFEQLEESYNMTDKDKEKIKEEIKKLNNGEILKLIKSDLKRNKFLQKLKLKDAKEKNIDDKLEGIDFSELEKKYKNNELDFEIYRIIEKFKTNPNNLNSEEIIKLLPFFNKKSQQNILKFYNGVFSLYDLVEGGILSKKDVTNYLKKSYEKIYPNMDKKEIEKILKGNIDISTIYITAQELRDKDLSKILEDKKILSDFFEVQNEAKKMEEEFIRKDFYDQIELDSSGKIHNNFISFLKNRGNKEGFSNELIDSLNNLNSGGYIEFKKNGKTYYSKIDEVDLGTIKEQKHILVKDLSDPKYEGKVRKDPSVIPTMMSYKNLYYLLKNASDDNNANVKFISEDDFNKKNIKEIEDEDNISDEESLKEKLGAEGILPKNLVGNKLEDLSLFDSNIEGGYYRNFRIQGNKIILDSGEEGTLSQLFNLLKNNKKKFKFEKKLKTKEDFLEKLGLSKEEYSIKNGALYYNPENAKKEIKVDYFTAGDKGDDAIFINKIKDDNIEYTIGSVKEKDSGKKDKNGKTIKKKEFKEKDKFYKTGFNNFTKDIHLKDGGDEINLSPFTEGIEIENKTEKGEELKMKGSFFGAWMSGMSLMEIISSGKMLIDSVEDHFKLGNQLKSAKLAEKMGWILPEEIRVKLKAAQEAASKKEMEERIFNVLTELNSKEGEGGTGVYDFIRKNVLENPYADNAMIFYAMKFMLEKKGALNVDGFLGNRGKFVWYKRLGGTVGDPLYNKVKAQRERAAPIKNGQPDPSFFEEEDLIEEKLAEMTKNGLIFSRADKDFSSSRNTGHERRHKKGLEEAGRLYSFTNRYTYFKSNLAKGEDDRAIGALEAVMGKNKSDPKLMNKAPFIMAMGAFAKDYDDVNIKRLVTLAWTSPYVSLYFASDKDAMAVYQGAIKQLFIDRGEKAKADELDRIINGDITKKVNKLDKFWDENAEVLGNFLNFSDGNIILKKGVDEAHKVYQKFYDTVGAVFGDKEFDYKKDAYLQTGMYQAHSGAAYVLMKLGGSANIGSNTGGSYQSNEAQQLVKIYYDTLNHIKSYKYDDNHKINREKQKKIFSMIYREFEPKVRGAIAALYERDGRESYKYSNQIYVSDLRKNNLILKAGNDEHLSDDEFMEKAFDTFIGEKLSLGGNDIIGEEAEDIKNKTSVIMEYSKEDYEPKEVHSEGDFSNNIDFEGVKRVV